MRVFAISCLCVCLAYASPSLAKIYKWVDENGRTHFSDSPIESDDQPAEEVKVRKINGSNADRSGSVFKEVTSLMPEQWSSQQQSRSFSLVKLEIDLDPSFETAAQQGKAKHYRAPRNWEVTGTTWPCEQAGDLSADRVNYLFHTLGANKLFNLIAQDYGFAHQPLQQPKFPGQRIKLPSVSLVATVNDYKISHCDSSGILNSSRPSQNSTYIKVTWQLYDNLARKVLSSVITEGVDDSLRRPARNSGARLSLQAAFKQASQNLLANSEFVSALKKNDKVDKAKQQKLTVLNDVKSHLGNKSLQFTQKSAAIRKATATIRTPSGHGSGFLMTSNGYVLTNQHVVGDYSDVKVIIAGQEMDASVVRSDAIVDVALLKLAADYPHPPVLLEASQPNLGEEFYVVGTPLDETLDFSISRGILSADRKREGRLLYQTDAAVNPGNSGGPVFNQYGNVVAITVAGIFDSYGGSKNINYLIPIKEAYKALNIPFPK